MTERGLASSLSLTASQETLACGEPQDYLNWLPPTSLTQG